MSRPFSNPSEGSDLNQPVLSTPIGIGFSLGYHFNFATFNIRNIPYIDDSDLTERNNKIGLLHNYYEFISTNNVLPGIYPIISSLPYTSNSSSNISDSNQLNEEYQHNANDAINTTFNSDFFHLNALLTQFDPKNPTNLSTNPHSGAYYTSQEYLRYIDVLDNLYSPIISDIINHISKQYEYLSLYMYLEQNNTENISQYFDSTLTKPRGPPGSPLLQKSIIADLHRNPFNYSSFCAYEVSMENLLTPTFRNTPLSGLSSPFSPSNESHIYPPPISPGDSHTAVHLDGEINYHNNVPSSLNIIVSPPSTTSSFKRYGNILQPSPRSPEYSFGPRNRLLITPHQSSQLNHYTDSQHSTPLDNIFSPPRNMSPLYEQGNMETSHQQVLQSFYVTSPTHSSPGASQLFANASICAPAYPSFQQTIPSVLTPSMNNIQSSPYDHITRLKPTQRQLVVQTGPNISFNGSINDSNTHTNRQSPKHIDRLLTPLSSEHSSNFIPISEHHNRPAKISFPTLAYFKPIPPLSAVTSPYQVTLSRLNNASHGRIIMNSGAHTSPIHSATTLNKFHNSSNIPHTAHTQLFRTNSPNSISSTSTLSSHRAHHQRYSTIEQPNDIYHDQSTSGSESNGDDDDTDANTDENSINSDRTYKHIQKHINILRDSPITIAVPPNLTTTHYNTIEFAVQNTSLLHHTYIIPETTAAAVFTFYQLLSTTHSIQSLTKKGKQQPIFIQIHPTPYGVYYSSSRVEGDKLVMLNRRSQYVINPYEEADLPQNHLQTTEPPLNPTIFNNNGPLSRFFNILVPHVMKKWQEKYDQNYTHIDTRQFCMDSSSNEYFIFVTALYNALISFDPYSYNQKHQEKREKLTQILSHPVSSEEVSEHTPLPNDETDYNTDFFDLSSSSCDIEQNMEKLHPKDDNSTIHLKIAQKNPDMHNITTFNDYVSTDLVIYCGQWGELIDNNVETMISLSRYEIFYLCKSMSYSLVQTINQLFDDVLLTTTVAATVTSPGDISPSTSSPSHVQLLWLTAVHSFSLSGDSVFYFLYSSLLYGCLLEHHYAKINHLDHPTSSLLYNTAHLQKNPHSLDSSLHNIFNNNSNSQISLHSRPNSITTNSLNSNSNSVIHSPTPALLSIDELIKQEFQEKYGDIILTNNIFYLLPNDIAKGAALFNTILHGIDVEPFYYSISQPQSSCHVLANYTPQQKSAFRQLFKLQEQFVERIGLYNFIDKRDYDLSATVHYSTLRQITRGANDYEKLALLTLEAFDQVKAFNERQKLKGGTETNHNSMSYSKKVSLKYKYLYKIHHSTRLAFTRLMYEVIQKGNFQLEKIVPAGRTIPTSTSSSCSLSNSAPVKPFTKSIALPLQNIIQRNYILSLPTNNEEYMQHVFSRAIVDLYYNTVSRPYSVKTNNNIAKKTSPSSKYNSLHFGRSNSDTNNNSHSSFSPLPRAIVNSNAKSPGKYPGNSFRHSNQHKIHLQEQHHLTSSLLQSQQLQPFYYYSPILLQQYLHMLSYATSPIVQDMGKIQSAYDSPYKLVHNTTQKPLNINANKISTSSNDIQKSPKKEQKMVNIAKTPLVTDDSCSSSQQPSFNNHTPQCIGQDLIMMDNDDNDFVTISRTSLSPSSSHKSCKRTLINTSRGFGRGHWYTNDISDSSDDDELEITVKGGNTHISHCSASQQLSVFSPFPDITDDLLYNYTDPSIFNLLGNSLNNFTQIYHHSRITTMIGEAHANGSLNRSSQYDDGVLILQLYQHCADEWEKKALYTSLNPNHGNSLIGGPSRRSSLLSTTNLTTTNSVPGICDDLYYTESQHIISTRQQSLLNVTPTFTLTPLPFTSDQIVVPTTALTHGISAANANGKTRHALSHQHDHSLVSHATSNEDRSTLTPISQSNSNIVAQSNLNNLLFPKAPLSHSNSSIPLSQRSLHSSAVRQDASFLLDSSMHQQIILPVTPKAIENGQLSLSNDALNMRRASSSTILNTFTPGISLQQLHHLQTGAAPTTSDSTSFTAPPIAQNCAQSASRPFSALSTVSTNPYNIYTIPQASIPSKTIPVDTIQISLKHPFPYVNNLIPFFNSIAPFYSNASPAETAEILSREGHTPKDIHNTKTGCRRELHQDDEETGELVFQPTPVPAIGMRRNIHRQQATVSANNTQQWGILQQQQLAHQSRINQQEMRLFLTITYLDKLHHSYRIRIHVHNFPITHIITIKYDQITHHKIINTWAKEVGKSQLMKSVSLLQKWLVCGGDGTHRYNPITQQILPFPLEKYPLLSIHPQTTAQPISPSILSTCSNSQGFEDINKAIDIARDDYAVQFPNDNASHHNNIHFYHSEPYSTLVKQKQNVLALIRRCDTSLNETHSKHTEQFLLRLFNHVTTCHGLTPSHLLYYPHLYTTEMTSNRRELNMYHKLEERTKFRHQFSVGVQSNSTDNSVRNLEAHNPYRDKGTAGSSHGYYTSRRGTTTPDFRSGRAAPGGNSAKFTRGRGGRGGRGGHGGSRSGLSRDEHDPTNYALTIAPQELYRTHFDYFLNCTRFVDWTVSPSQFSACPIYVHIPTGIQTHIFPMCPQSSQEQQRAQSTSSWKHLEVQPYKHVWFNTATRQITYMMPKLIANKILAKHPLYEWRFGFFTNDKIVMCNINTNQILLSFVADLDKRLQLQRLISIAQQQIPYYIYNINYHGEHIYPFIYKLQFNGESHLSQIDPELFSTHNQSSSACDILSIPQTSSNSSTLISSLLSHDKQFVFMKRLQFFKHLQIQNILKLSKYASYELNHIKLKVNLEYVKLLHISFNNTLFIISSSFSQPDSSNQPTVGGGLDQTSHGSSSDQPNTNSSSLYCSLSPQLSTASQGASFTKQKNIPATNGNNPHQRLFPVGNDDYTAILDQANQSSVSKNPSKFSMPPRNRHPSLHGPTEHDQMSIHSRSSVGSSSSHHSIINMNEVIPTRHHQHPQLMRNTQESPVAMFTSTSQTNNLDNNNNTVHISTDTHRFLPSKLDTPSSSVYNSPSLPEIAGTPLFSIPPPSIPSIPYSRTQGYAYFWQFHYSNEFIADTTNQLPTMMSRNIKTIGRDENTPDMKNDQFLVDQHKTNGIYTWRNNNIMKLDVNDSPDICIQHIEFLLNYQENYVNLIQNYQAQATLTSQPQSFPNRVGLKSNPHPDYIIIPLVTKLNREDVSYIINRYALYVRSTTTMGTCLNETDKYYKDYYVPKYKRHAVNLSQSEKIRMENIKPDDSVQQWLDDVEEYAYNDVYIQLLQQLYYYNDKTWLNHHPTDTFVAPPPGMDINILEKTPDMLHNDLHITEVLENNILTYLEYKLLMNHNLSTPANFISVSTHGTQNIGGSSGGGSSSQDNPVQPFTALTSQFKPIYIISLLDYHIYKYIQRKIQFELIELYLYSYHPSYYDKYVINFDTNNMSPFFKFLPSQLNPPPVLTPDESAVSSNWCKVPRYVNYNKNDLINNTFADCWVSLDGCNVVVQHYNSKLYQPIIQTMKIPIVVDKTNNKNNNSESQNISTCNTSSIFTGDALTNQLFADNMFLTDCGSSNPTQYNTNPNDSHSSCEFTRVDNNNSTNTIPTTPNDSYYLVTELTPVNSYLTTHTLDLSQSQQTDYLYDESDMSNSEAETITYQYQNDLYRHNNRKHDKNGENSLNNLISNNHNKNINGNYFNISSEVANIHHIDPIQGYHVAHTYADDDYCMVGQASASDMSLGHTVDIHTPTLGSSTPFTSCLRANHNLGAMPLAGLTPLDTNFSSATTPMKPVEQSEAPSPLIINYSLDNHHNSDSNNEENNYMKDQQDILPMVMTNTLPFITTDNTCSNPSKPRSIWKPTLNSHSKSQFKQKNAQKLKVYQTQVLSFKHRFTNEILDDHNWYDKESQYYSSLSPLTYHHQHLLNIQAKEAVLIANQHNIENTASNYAEQIKKPQPSIIIHGMGTVATSRFNNESDNLINNMSYIITNPASTRPDLSLQGHSSNVQSSSITSISQMQQLSLPTIGNHSNGSFSTFNAQSPYIECPPVLSSSSTESSSPNYLHVLDKIQSEALSELHEIHSINAPALSIDSFNRHHQHDNMTITDNQGNIQNSSPQINTHSHYRNINSTKVISFTEQERRRKIAELRDIIDITNILYHPEHRSYITSILSNPLNQYRVNTLQQHTYVNIFTKKKNNHKPVATTQSRNKIPTSSVIFKDFFIQPSQSLPFIIKPWIRTGNSVVLYLPAQNRSHSFATKTLQFQYNYYGHNILNTRPEYNMLNYWSMQPLFNSQQFLTAPPRLSKKSTKNLKSIKYPKPPGRFKSCYTESKFNYYSKYPILSIDIESDDYSSSESESDEECMKKEREMALKNEFDALSIHSITRNYINNWYAQPKILMSPQFILTSLSSNNQRLFVNNTIYNNINNIIPDYYYYSEPVFDDSGDVINTTYNTGTLPSTQLLNNNHHFFETVSQPAYVNTSIRAVIDLVNTPQHIGPSVLFQKQKELFTSKKYQKQPKISPIEDPFVFIPSLQHLYGGGFHHNSMMLYSLHYNRIVNGTCLSDYPDDSSLHKGRTSPLQQPHSSQALISDFPIHQFDMDNDALASLPRPIEIPSHSVFYSSSATHSLSSSLSPTGGHNNRIYQLTPPPKAPARYSLDLKTSNNSLASPCPITDHSSQRHHQQRRGSRTSASASSSGQSTVSSSSTVLSNLFLRSPVNNQYISANAPSIINNNHTINHLSSVMQPMSPLKSNTPSQFKKFSSSQLSVDPISYNTDSAMTDISIAQAINTRSYAQTPGLQVQRHSHKPSDISSLVDGPFDSLLTIGTVSSHCRGQMTSGEYHSPNHDLATIQHYPDFSRGSPNVFGAENRCTRENDARNVVIDDHQSDFGENKDIEAASDQASYYRYAYAQSTTSSSMEHESSNTTNPNDSNDGRQQLTAIVPMNRSANYFSPGNNNTQSVPEIKTLLIEYQDVAPGSLMFSHLSGKTIPLDNYINYYLIKNNLNFILSQKNAVGDKTTHHYYNKLYLQTKRYILSQHSQPKLYFLPHIAHYYNNVTGHTQTFPPSNIIYTIERDNFYFYNLQSFYNKSILPRPIICAVRPLLYPQHTLMTFQQFTHGQTTGVSRANSPHRRKDGYDTDSEDFIYDGDDISDENYHDVSATQREEDKLNIFFGDMALDTYSYPFFYQRTFAMALEHWYHPVKHHITGKSCYQVKISSTPTTLFNTVGHTDPNSTPHDGIHFIPAPVPHAIIPPLTEPSQNVVIKQATKFLHTRQPSTQSHLSSPQTLSPILHSTTQVTDASSATMGQIVAPTILLPSSSQNIDPGYLSWQHPYNNTSLPSSKKQTTLIQTTTHQPIDQHGYISHLPAVLHYFVSQTQPYHWTYKCDIQQWQYRPDLYFDVIRKEYKQTKKYIIMNIIQALELYKLFYVLTSIDRQKATLPPYISLAHHTDHRASLLTAIGSGNLSPLFLLINQLTNLITKLSFGSDISPSTVDFLLPQSHSDPLQLTLSLPKKLLRSIYRKFNPISIYFGPHSIIQDSNQFVSPIIRPPATDYCVNIKKQITAFSFSYDQVYQELCDDLWEKAQNTKNNDNSRNSKSGLSKNGNPLKNFIIDSSVCEKSSDFTFHFKMMQQNLSELMKIRQSGNEHTNDDPKIHEVNHLDSIIDIIGAKLQQYTTIINTQLIKPNHVRKKQYLLLNQKNFVTPINTFYNELMVPYLTKHVSIWENPVEIINSHKGRTEDIFSPHSSRIPNDAYELKGQRYFLDACESKDHSNPHDCASHRDYSNQCDKRCSTPSIYPSAPPQITQHSVSVKYPRNTIVSYTTTAFAEDHKRDEYSSSLFPSQPDSLHSCVGSHRIHDTLSQEHEHLTLVNLQYKHRVLNFNKEAVSLQYYNNALYTQERIHKYWNKQRRQFLTYHLLPAYVRAKLIKAERKVQHRP